MDTIDSLVQIVARYSDAQLAEARDMMARWDAEEDMPASLVTLARIIEEEARYRQAEDMALREGRTMTSDQVLAAGHMTWHYCDKIRATLDQLFVHYQACFRAINDADAAVTAQIEALGTTHAVWAADLRAARNLLTKLAASLEHVRQDLQIALDATDGLDHQAAILLAFDLSDTLPWTEDAR